MPAPRAPTSLPWYLVESAVCCRPASRLSQVSSGPKRDSATASAPRRWQQFFHTVFCTQHVLDAPGPASARAKRHRDYFFRGVYKGLSREVGIIAHTVSHGRYGYHRCDGLQVRQVWDGSWRWPRHRSSFGATRLLSPWCRSLHLSGPCQARCSLGCSRYLLSCPHPDPLCLL